MPVDRLAEAGQPTPFERRHEERLVARLRLQLPRAQQPRARPATAPAPAASADGGRRSRWPAASGRPRIWACAQAHACVRSGRPARAGHGDRGQRAPGGRPPSGRSISPSSRTIRHSHGVEPVAGGRVGRVAPGQVGVAELEQREVVRLGVAGARRRPGAAHGAQRRIRPRRRARAGRAAGAGHRRAAGRQGHRDGDARVAGGRARLDQRGQAAPQDREEGVSGPSSSLMPASSLERSAGRLPRRGWRPGTAGARGGRRAWFRRWRCRPGARGRRCWRRPTGRRPA